MEFSCSEYLEWTDMPFSQGPPTIGSNQVFFIASCIGMSSWPAIVHPRLSTVAPSVHMGSPRCEYHSAASPSPRDLPNPGSHAALYAYLPGFTSATWQAHAHLHTLYVKTCSFWSYMGEEDRKESSGQSQRFYLTPAPHPTLVCDIHLSYMGDNWERLKV